MEKRLKYDMRKLLAPLLLAFASFASAQTCTTCIQNSANPQNAQINIGTATIRGTLTVNDLVAAALNLGAITAGTFTGDGSHLTVLNATQLSSGTVPAARLSGAYTGITSVGALSAGTWQGTPVSPQYGGTGQNFASVSTGSIIYFNGNGTMTTLLPSSPQALLQTNGFAAPVWTSSPAVSGANMFGIPLTALNAGNLPKNIIVSSNSIPYVDGASVFGNINGSVSTYTGTIALSQLAAGTLPSTVVASSITGTGVIGGVYGDASHIPQLTLRTDGRVSTVTVLGLSVPLANLQSGALPGGVTVPAANVSAGALNGGVIASSLTATGATPGTYGSATQAPQITVSADGRISSVTQFPIGGLSSSTVFSNVDNNWSHAQTSQSSWTINSNLLVQSSVTAGAFFGDGSHLNGVTFQGGTVPNITTFLSQVISQKGFSTLYGMGASTATFGTNNQISSFTNTGSLYMPGGSTIAARGGWLYFSTAAPLDANPVNSAEIDNNANLRVNGQGLDALTISPNLLATSIVSATPVLAVENNVFNGVQSQSYAYTFNGADVTGVAITGGNIGGSNKTSTQHTVSSGTLTNTATWATAPAFNTQLDAYGVSVSTGSNRYELASWGTQVDSNAKVGGAGTSAIIPTRFNWRLTDSAGTEQTYMVLQDSGTLELGPNAGAAGQDTNSTVRLHVVGSSATVDGTLNAGNVVVTSSLAIGRPIIPGAIFSAQGYTGAVNASTDSVSIFYSSGLAAGITADLAIVSDGGAPFQIMRGYGGTQSVIRQHVNGGSLASPSATQTGYEAFYAAGGHDGTNESNGKARVSMAATQNWTTSATGMNVKVSGTPQNTTSTKLYATFDEGGLSMSSSTLNAGWITTPSSVTASTYFGDGSHLTGITVSAPGISTGAVTTAALTGNGNSTSPLGINSSSVAVLSGGFVQNAQLDSSSVTKQGFVTLANLSGSVPSGRVDFSTITTALATKASTGTDNSMTRANALATFGASAVTFIGSTTANGAILGKSSVTASAFFGDGSHLSGIVATGVCALGAGTTSIVCSGSSNSAIGTNSEVGGGSGNTANDTNSTIPGGNNNQATGNYSTIGGGNGNTTGGTNATVAGGASNTANNVSAFVGGGNNNNAADSRTVVVGGTSNTSLNQYDVVVGGEGNEAQGGHSFCGAGQSNNAFGQWSSIAGGRSNDSHGDYSAIPGGQGNTSAGSWAFAAGQNASASTDNSFTWSDGTVYTDHGTQTFNANATGGTFFDGGNVNVASSMTVTGTTFMGWAMVTNSCGAGVTTCNADCALGSVLTGGGCNAGVALSKDAPNSASQWGCTSLTVTTLTAYAFCGRLAH